MNDSTIFEKSTIESIAENNLYTFKDDKGKEPYDLIDEYLFRAVVGNSDYFWAKQLKDVSETLDFSMFHIFKAIKDVLKYGLKKYGKVDSWKFVECAQNRYFAAMMRHEEKHYETKSMNLPALDEESGLPHWYHVVTNMYFLLYFEILEKENENK